MTRVVVLDYGSGNVRSAVRALERTGADTELVDSYLRPQDGSARALADAIAATLAAGDAAEAAPSDSTAATTGTDS